MRNILPALSLLGILFCACKQKKAAQKDTTPTNVPVVTVKATCLSLDHFYVSDIRAVRNVELRSKISGFLDAIYVDEGEHVKKGQLLFRINDVEHRANVAKARAALNTSEAEAQVAEVEYQRVKMLTDKNIVSKTELALASSKLRAAAARTEEARSDLDNALHRLSYTSICAPFDGTVDRIPFKTGSLIAEGTLMTSVSDISSVYAYFDISENEYLAYTRKQHSADPGKYLTADLVLADGQAYKYKGKVETVVSEFDENTGSISFRATFPNPENLLKHKATGKVKLTTKMEKALVVPQKSSFEVQDKNYVFVLNDSNVVRMKSFVPSGRINQYYIIKSGLDEGDRVVYEGIQDLKEGMQVIPTPLPTDSLSRVAAY